MTGTIGDAALGLCVLKTALPPITTSAAVFLLDRYRLPQPRVSLGPQLIGLATAGIDISDGLVADLRHICEVSGLDASIEAESVPLSRAVRTIVARDPERLMTALTGGDDYELLFTAPQTAAARFAELSRSTGTSITPIGRMAAPSHATHPGVVVLDARGDALEIASEGWTHFARGAQSRT